ncbi:YceI family protein [Mucilaginibacter sp. BT774]|uniref:YceI family protein n=1 Tax=Mucilaginibacter sp. BT774 TaxID=3062276 RepID=UPI0026750F1F|nr:YceI family protein [Mucilaginibacter sp. BT774]MDO3628593.1 YceI family protein [Mucilaginibacter sp. BT774]
MKILTITQMLIVTTPLLISVPGKALSYHLTNRENIQVVTHPVKSQSYQVDTHASKISWLAKKVTGAHHGGIAISNGELHVKNDMAIDGSLHIDIRSITDADLTDKASNDKLITTLKGETFFNSAKYPDAAFVSTSVAHASGSQYIVKGNLTIKGITNEVIFPATIIINKKKIIATAKISLDRTKFDIKIRSKSFFENLGDKVIYDNFDLDITLSANAE